MRTIFRLLVITVGIGLLVYAFRTIPLSNIREEIANRTISFERNNTFLADWDTELVLDKINLARESAGYSKVKINEQLNKAALSRLSVILTEQDYEGAITGLTRETAVKNAGYDANIIGDLVLMDFFKTNDPVAFWEADDITRATLLHKDFREVGIAIKNEQDKVNVYVVMVSPRRKTAAAPAVIKTAWGGPQLWEVVNKRRVELGVNPLKQKEELCTIASIRLNQLLDLGKLDGHAGFVPVLERPDLKWISEKYNISEFLAQGYPTPEETVKAWENTLGHKALLSGGEYVWGCIYAQNAFAVAIAAY